MAVDRAADFHEPARAKVFCGVRHNDVRPPALVATLFQLGSELFVKCAHWRPQGRLSGMAMSDTGSPTATSVPVTSIPAPCSR